MCILTGSEYMPISLSGADLIKLQLPANYFSNRPISGQLLNAVRANGKKFK